MHVYVCVYIYIYIYIYACICVCIYTYTCACVCVYIPYMYVYFINVIYFPLEKLKHSKFSVSHDHSEIVLICWFYAQETFIIIIKVDAA